MEHPPKYWTSSTVLYPLTRGAYQSQKSVRDFWYLLCDFFKKCTRFFRLICPWPSPVLPTPSWGWVSVCYRHIQSVLTAQTCFPSCWADGIATKRFQFHRVTLQTTKGCLAKTRKQRKQWFHHLQLLTIKHAHFIRITFWQVTYPVFSSLREQSLADSQYQRSQSHSAIITLRLLCFALKRRVHIKTLFLFHRDDSRG